MFKISYRTNHLLHNFFCTLVVSLRNSQCWRPEDADLDLEIMKFSFFSQRNYPKKHLTSPK